jgi:2-phosphosulfolactate phosphatase
MKIHVLLKKEELDAQRLPGKTVVVLDILFATSSIVAALAHGAAEVIPTLDGAAAQAEAARHPAGSCVLSGELNAETLPGFVHPTPLHLLAENLAGRTLVYSTTNGTVAVAKSREADHVYAAALLNGEAVVKHIARATPTRRC